MLASPRRFALSLATCLCLIAAVSLFAPTRAGASATASYAVRVPILMYHYIRVNPNPRDRVGADLSVPPARFTQEMQYLVANGYHTVTLDDLVAAIEHGAALPPKPVILTFDDGYEDLYTAAYPVLKEYGLKATSFVITGKVGWPGYLTWPQLKEMEASGLVQAESHTVDHVEMNHVSLAKAQYELTRSKSVLEQQLGTEVRYFCYPSGRYDWQVESMLPKDGYVAAVSTRFGTVHSMADIDALTRVRIHGADTLASFAAALNGH